MFDRCSLEVSFLPSLLPSFVLPSCSSSSVAFLMFRLCIFGALLSFLEKSLSKVYRKSIEVYRTSIDRNRKSIESLSKAYRKSIGKSIESLLESLSKLLSKVYRTSVAILSKVRRISIESTSIESLSNGRGVPKDSLWLDLWAFFVVWQCTGVEKPTSMNAPETTACAQMLFTCIFQTRSL